MSTTTETIGWSEDQQALAAQELGAWLAVLHAPNLDALLSALVAHGAVEQECYQEGVYPEHSSRRDWSNLPVFDVYRGPPSRVMRDGAVWSWDDTRVLVGSHAGDLRIVARDDAGED